MSKLVLFAFGATIAAACASNSDGGQKAVTPAGSGGQYFGPIGPARTELIARERDVELAAGDCQKACKALASLERAANQLCTVAEPDECTDARSRVDRARRAVQAQCGGC